MEKPKQEYRRLQQGDHVRIRSSRGPGGGHWMRGRFTAWRKPMKVALITPTNHKQPIAMKLEDFKPWTAKNNADSR